MRGTRLGPYEILQQLGAGGMGEVWLAEDTRLGRKVAVKVLPPEFAADPERLARFEQESRAAAALNHPNIAAVYDVGHDDGTHYFVQEYLQGTPLDERLAQGRLPLPEAVRLGTGIARALAAAHRAGVVHRDLKPANVFVTEDGDPKVLDFGLAKMTGVASSDASESPTQLGTMTGAIMGTAGYMAPEQVQGQPVDGRTDMFAFGCLLYEMVGGERAFHGDSVIQTMNRIVHEPPRPLQQLAPAPRELLRIIRKCLAKDAARRYQSADDLAIDLEAFGDELREGRTAIPPAGASAAGLTSGPTRLAAAVVLIAVAAAAAWIGASLGTGREAPAEPRYLNLVASLLPRNDPPLAISPDGQTIAYVGAGASGEQSLFVRALESPDARRLAGTDTAHSPFFSPDGDWVGYFNDADRSLRKISLVTGEVRTLAVTPEGHRGGAFTDDGHVVFASYRGGLGRVPADGGAVQGIAESDERSLRFPAHLPGTGDVLATVEHFGEDGVPRTSIALVRMGDGTVVELLDEASDPRYLHADMVLFRRQSALLVAAFDPEAPAVRGEPVLLFDNLAVTTDGPLAFDISRTGELLGLRAEDYPLRDRRTVVRSREQGSFETIIAEPDAYRALTLSPDGNRLAVQIGDPATSATEVWLYDIDEGTRARLATPEGIAAFAPAWSPDGDRVAFTVESGAAWDLGLYRSDLSSPLRTVPIRQPVRAPLVIGFHPDGDRFLLSSFVDLDTVWSISLSGDPTPVLVATNTGPGQSLSPDGRWVAFQLQEGGRNEIYVLELASGRRWPVSSNGGEAPTWRADGAELYYWRGDTLVARRVRAVAGSWRSDPPVDLLTGRFVRMQDSFAAYAIAPDGRTAYLIPEPETETAMQSRLEYVDGVATLARRALDAR